MAQQATYAPPDLETFAVTLLERTGLKGQKAATIARILVEGELRGRMTHGLALLAPYLEEIESGGMATAGEPEVISDFGACLAWDGRKLPGPWLISSALDEAMSRAARFGIGAVTIQRSHHTASLGAYLTAATDKGYLAFITLTDPGFSSVAPFGGTTPVLTSNPFAFGAPADPLPILVDVSTSMLTNGMVAKMKRERRMLDAPWLLTADGEPSRDPGVVFETPPGTVLPLGGLEAGHKGYGLGMMIEVLSGCLSGFGRAEPHGGWSASVFVMAIKPEAFGSTEAYRKQVNWLVDACRRASPRQGFDRVRLPGETGNERRAAALRDGLAVSSEVRDALAPWMRKFKVDFPAAF